jgi:hypothetical protein
MPLNAMVIVSVKLQECPLGTYKNVTGSSKSLCFPCPPQELPHRAIYINVRGNSFCLFFFWCSINWKFYLRTKSDLSFEFAGLRCHVFCLTPFFFSLYIAVLDRHPDNDVTSIFLTLLMFDRRCC